MLQILFTFMKWSGLQKTCVNARLISFMRSYLGFIFASKAGTCPIGEYRKGAPLMWVTTLHANNRQGWKGLPRTNTQAHLVSSSVTKKKVLYH